jgi:DHA1 family multidrug resistance protein-like MFS transporter
MSGYESHNARDVKLLLVAMGINALPLGYTLVVLPIYLSNLGFSGEVIGAITAASSLGSTIGLIPFAIAADRYGRKLFVVWGFLSATLAYIFFAFTRDLNSLLIAGAIGGIGLAGGFSTAVWTPAWTALISEKAGTKERTRAFAWSQGIWTIALTAGSASSVLPAFFRAHFKSSFLASYEYPFLIFVGLSILSGLVLLPISESKVIQAGLDGGRRWNFLPKKSRPQIAKFSATLGLVGFGSGIGLQLLSLWFNRVYGTSETSLGLWFAVAEITSLIVIPIVPRLTKSLGTPKSVLITQGLSASLMASMVLAPTYQFAASIFIVRNFFMNLAWPVQQSYLMGTVTPDERASASAITYTIWGIGNSVSPILAGYFLSQASSLSLSAPLIIGGAAYLAGAVGFYVLFRGTPPPEEVLPLSKIGHEVM